MAPKLILLLYKNNRHAEFAATAVRNLVFDNKQVGAILVREGAVEALMIIIQCNSCLDARKQALAAVVNLSNEPATTAPEKLCSTGAVDVFCQVISQVPNNTISLTLCVHSQEVLTFSRSRKEEEFQWAAWCAVVLHNLMEYNDIFEKVVSAFHRQSPTSPFRNKVKTLKPTEFKNWIANLTAKSAADFL